MKELPLHVDSTMLTTFRSCKQKFFFEYVERLRPKKASIHLHAGGAFAAGVEAWREAHYIGGATSEEAQLAGIKAFIEFWKDVEPDDEWEVKTFPNMLRAISSYMDTYPLEKDHVQPLRPGSFEYSFAIPTRTLHPSGVPFIFAGRIDLLGQWNGWPVVLDEKTTKSLGAAFANKWKMRGQFLGYLWAVRQIGIRATRAIVRGTGILKTEITHMEVPVSFPEHMIDVWADEMENTLGEMVHYWGENRWPRDLAEACYSYSPCPYILPCSAKRPEIWYPEYAENTWNPVLRNPAMTAEAMGNIKVGDI